MKLFSYMTGQRTRLWCVHSLSCTLIILSSLKVFEYPKHQFKQLIRHISTQLYA
nr:MAG TPA: hypothetical protein [Bacteriophage sp.]